MKIWTVFYLLPSGFVHNPQSCKAVVHGETLKDAMPGHDIVWHLGANTGIRQVVNQLPESPTGNGVDPGGGLV